MLRHSLGPQIIVEKMIDYLRGVTDDIAKADVVHRIGDLAERYAPDTQWFIDTMNQVGLPGQVSCCSCALGGKAVAGAEGS
jgi:AP-4 complex subunit epsilon-1